MTVPHGNLDELTDRERDILELLARGLSDRDIAQQLVLTVGTVKWYNREIYSKLGVKNRTQAVVKAQDLGLLSTPTTPPSTKLPRTNLPVPLSSFVGRTHELAEVQRLLKTTRLLTLTGPPGSGKTRLAIQMAHEVLDDYPDGIWFVALASLRDADLVMSSVAHTLKIRVEHEQSVLATLENRLRDRRLLLILDNVEHLLPAGPDVAQLLANAPAITVLVTSREVLNVNGEQEYPVPPLDLPSPGVHEEFDELYTNEAVRLFVSRVQSVVPEFELTTQNADDVVAICIRLDGLPLAIELAASRIKLFAPATLRNQLQDRFAMLTGGARDLPPRMQTLQSALDWSWHLLSAVEQVFFSRLGLFVDSFSLAAADAICSSGNTGSTTTELLMSLANKSLVFSTPESGSRFAMLETVREFALQRLEIGGEAERMRNRHTDYYVERVQQVNRTRHDGSGRFLQLLEDFVDEHSNLRAALHWLLVTRDSERALRMVGGLADFWWLYGYAPEGLRWAERALSASPKASPIGRAHALRARGLLLYETGQFERAVVACEPAAAIFRDSGNTFELAWMLAYLGATYDEMHDERATSMLDESLALFKEVDSPLGIAFSLNHLGEVMRHMGDHERALEFYEASLIHREGLYGMAGNPVRSLVNLGFALHTLGQLDRAVEAFEQALTNSVTLGLGSKWTVETLIGFAAVFAGEQRGICAVRLLGTINEICQTHGLSLMYQQEYDDLVDRLRRGVNPATFQRAWTAGHSMSLDGAVTTVLQAINEDGRDELEGSDS